MVSECEIQILSTCSHDLNHRKLVLNFLQKLVQFCKPIFNDLKKKISFNNYKYRTVGFEIPIFDMCKNLFVFRCRWK